MVSFEVACVKTGKSLFIMKHKLSFFSIYSAGVFGGDVRANVMRPSERRRMFISIGVSVYQYCGVLSCVQVYKCVSSV